jgi:hypothetical protein
LNYRFDNGAAELSSSQFCLVKSSSLISGLAERATEWNSLCHRRTLADLHATALGSRTPTPFGRWDTLFNGLLAGDGPWVDIIHEFPVPINLSTGLLHCIVDVDADEPVSVRVAVVSGAEDDKSVCDMWFVLPPGLSTLTANFADFSGQPHRTNVHSLLIGGPLAGSSVKFGAILEAPSIKLKLFG